MTAPTRNKTIRMYSVVIAILELVVGQQESW